MDDVFPGTTDDGRSNKLLLGPAQADGIGLILERLKVKLNRLRGRQGRRLKVTRLV
jgi:hypothetical protein